MYHIGHKGAFTKTISCFCEDENDVTKLEIDINTFCRDKHIINKQYISVGCCAICFIDYIPGKETLITESELPY